MFGRTRFPRIGELPYLLTLAPRGFFWFQLRGAEGTDEHAGARSRRSRPRRRRWRAGSSRSAGSAPRPARWRTSSVLEAVPLRRRAARCSCSRWCEARFHAGHPRALPAAVGMRPPTASWESGVIAQADDWAVYDALADPALARELLRYMRATDDVAGRGRRAGVPLDRAASATSLGDRPEVRPMGVEQSNSSVVFGDALVLKAYRRMEPGDQPRARAAAVPLRARLRQHRPARGLVRVRGPPDRRDARDPAGVRARRAGRLGARARPARTDPDAFLDRLAPLGEVTGRDARGARARTRPTRRSRPRSRATRRCRCSPPPSTRRSSGSSSSCPTTPSLAPIAGRGQDVRERLRRMVPIGAGGPRHPHPRRLPPRPDDADRRGLGRSSTSRASRPAAASSGGASARRCATWPGMLRSFAYAASASQHPARRPAPDGWEDARSRGVPGGLLRRRSTELMPPGPGAIEKLLACSSSRRPSTSCATSSTTGPTGSASRWRASARLLEALGMSATAADVDALVAPRASATRTACSGPTGRRRRRRPRVPPGRRAASRVRPDGEPRRAGADPPRRPLRGRGRGRYAAAALRARGRLRRRRRVHRTRPVRASRRRSASSTSTSSARAATSSSTSDSARTCASVDGVAGPRSPSGRRPRASVSVVGDFNRWDGRLHPMRALGASGIWELFVPGVGEATRYKYEIRRAGRRRCG